MRLLRTVIGAISGIVATGPMTAAMILLHRRLPSAEQYPLPPREITMKLAEKAGVAEDISYEGRSAATFLAHFGYGAATGAIYGSWADQLSAPPPARGMFFGLLVWSASYLGLLPGTGILSPATAHPARRNLLMIAAHLIWGAALGLLFQLFIDESRGTASPPLSTSVRPHRDSV